MSGAVAWDRAARDIDDACMEPANLARVLQVIGLTMELRLSRGDVPGWPPAYRGHVPWRQRYAASATLAGRGWRAGAWGAAEEAAMDAADAAERDAIAAHNRALRDSEVFVLGLGPVRKWRGTHEVAQARKRRGARAGALAAYMTAWRRWCAVRCAPRFRAPPPPRLGDFVCAAGSDLPEQLVFLDLRQFEWRDQTGAAAGQGLADLAAWVRSWGRGRAIACLARAVGVDLLTPAEHERQVQGVERVSQHG